MEDNQQEEKIITEYVETEEGEGISIIPLKEKEINIDKDKQLITDAMGDN